MRLVRRNRIWGAATAALLVCVAHAQSQNLTLEDALKLAAQRNGDVRSAFLQAKSAHEGTNISFAAFLPQITPEYEYQSDREQLKNLTGNGNSFVQTEAQTSAILSSWTLLDSGQREFNYSASKRSEDAARASALETLRTVLFTVHQQYYDALRAQELERVADLQVQQTKTILDQTTARAELGDEAKKDTLQANADYLNAKVSLLSAKSNTAVATATLKATIGYDRDQPLPPLVKPQEPTDFPTPPTLEQMVTDGLKNRQDIVAERDRVAALHDQAESAWRDAGLSLSLDATFDRDLSPDNFQSRTFTLLLSYPLFDGGALRSQARQADYGFQSEQATLDQLERTARSDIESAYTTLSDDSQRVSAAKAALDAAQTNYDAAVAAQKAGAAGTDVVTVLTAQVSLVTAESNYVQAIYDYYIAAVDLRLVTGQSIPGENLIK